LVEGTTYKVVITTSAKNRFQREIISYLLLHFSLNKVIQIETNIQNEIILIAKNPKRGTKERTLNNLLKPFRYILIKESRNVELKIIYMTYEDEQTVIITDFFPTKMSPDRMLNS
jgi:plasmid stabilization system protein ParE